MMKNFKQFFTRTKVLPTQPARKNITLTGQQQTELGRLITQKINTIVAESLDPINRILAETKADKEQHEQKNITNWQTFFGNNLNGY